VTTLTVQLVGVVEGLDRQESRLLDLSREVVVLVGTGELVGALGQDQRGGGGVLDLDAGIKTANRKGKGFSSFVT